MNIGLIFDLDLTLIDSKLGEPYRNARQWLNVYETIPNFKPYEGMSEVLSYIDEQNIPYCIVTSSPSTYCLKVCQHWNINSSLCVCYHDTPTGQKKPHPAPILLAVQKLSIPPANILSFGDRDIDIVASHGAGIKSVACLWGTEDRKTLLAANPTYMLEQPRDSISLIRNFLSS